MRRTPHPRRVFLDSSGFLALINLKDVWHQQARTAWSQLTEERWSTFTTNFVIAETHALFLARIGRAAAADFLRGIDQSGTTIVRVAQRDEDQARSIVFRYDDKDFSFTDATCFAVMERLRIGAALTFDPNFSQYGLQVVGPEKP
ncbi:MAG: twitching motility protein PilT [Microgenomates group bacterium Gr01-1014_80]|nr:MAG: twitching motility protein PilT [Microgenomates group bacterium Gr01-1014_80]